MSDPAGDFGRCVSMSQERTVDGSDDSHAYTVNRAQPTYYPQWLMAWGGMSLLAVLNGLSRGLYADQLGEVRAHQVSSATLAAALRMRKWSNADGRFRHQGQQPRSERLGWA